MMEKEKNICNQQQRACCLCKYFQMKHWDIGYCRLHQVNVLQSYSCSKFVPQEKADDETGQETDVEGMAFNAAPRHDENA
jgi:hypothetical protein